MNAEDLVLVLFAAIAVVAAIALGRHTRRHRQGEVPTRALLAGNALALVVIVSLVLFAGELYCRFVFDSTDSFGLTKVSRQWVERNVASNAQGFRDDVDYVRAGTAGEHRRVTFFGDSFLAGWGIADVGDRFANRVRAAHTEWTVEVRARFGSDTIQEIADLRSAIAEGHRPDVAVLVYCLNDIQRASPAAGEHDARIRRYRERESGWLVRHSFLLDRLAFRLRAALDPALGDYFGLLDAAYRGASWSVQAERLDGLVEVARDHAIDLRVVTFPFLHALGEDYAFRDAHQRLDAFWESRDVPHLDLLDVFGDANPADVVVNAWDAHPNEAAHARAADAIGPFLETPGRPIAARTDPTRGAMLAWPAIDEGVILTHGGPEAACVTPAGERFEGACDAMGARDAWIFRGDGGYLLHYDAAGALGWLNARAESSDLRSWVKAGPILDLGGEGTDDEAGADYGVPFFDGERWHLFYLGAGAASPPPERIPAIPYTTMKAEADSSTGPWRKRPDVRPFDPEPGTWYAETTSPGPIVEHADGWIQIVSGAARYGDALYRTLGLARTRDLDGRWTIDPDPILPPTEQIENASLHYEETSRTWFLFTNRVHVSDRFTDAIVVYWSDDLERWSPERKALVLDGRHSGWSRSVIGLPSVIPAEGRLAVVYDGHAGRSPSHVGRDLGLAWLDRPLDPARIEATERRVGVTRRFEMDGPGEIASTQQLDVRFVVGEGRDGTRLVARSTPPFDDPFVVLAGPPIWASEFDELRFRARITAPDDGRGSIYFFHADGFDALPFDVRPGWQTVRVDLARSPDWAGRIDRLRIDPPGSTGPSTLEIDWIELGSRRRRGR